MLRVLPIDWYVRRWLMRQRRRLGPTITHAGIPIYGDSDTPRVVEALQEIERRDPRRLRAMARVGVAIEIVTNQPSHQYDPATNVIGLDAGVLARQNTQTLAVSIVHEAAHARIARSGIPYNSRTADRIEARCVEEEIAYVARYLAADDAQFVAWAAQKRKRLERRWWTHKAQLTAYADLAQAQGDPRWMVAFMRFLARWTW